MKKFLLLAGVACLFSAQAQAIEVNPYVAGRLSYDFNKVKTKAAAPFGKMQEKINKDLVSPHFAFGASAGYVRGELELNLSHAIKDSNKLGKMNLKKYSVMANAYFDYLTCTPWTPYVGAGLGYAWLKGVDHLGGYKFFDKSVYNLAWQVMAGINYEINTHWSIDAGYKYADLGRIRKNFGGLITKTSVRDHEIMLGARYAF